MDGGEPKLPTTFIDYELEPREYHLSTIQTVVQTHTRVTDLYSNRIDQLREQVRLTVEAVKEREEWEIDQSRSIRAVKGGRTGTTDQQHERHTHSR